MFIAYVDEHLRSKTQIEIEKSTSVKSYRRRPLTSEDGKRERVKSASLPGSTFRTERRSSVKSNQVSRKADHLSTKTRRSSAESFTSHASAMLVKEQLKLEAAKVRLKYTEKEQELARQKAALDADLEKLEREREVDEAESKVQTIQEALQDSSGDNFTENSEVNEDVVMDRTEQFVIQDSYERLNIRTPLFGTDSKQTDTNDSNRCRCTCYYE